MLCHYRPDIHPELMWQIINEKSKNVMTIDIIGQMNNNVLKELQISNKLKHIAKIVTYTVWITGIIKIDKTYLKPPNNFHRTNLKDI